MSQNKGRQGQPSDQIYQDTVPRKSSEQGILVKMDQLIDAIKALTSKMDADFADVTNASTDYAAVISDAISKIELK